ncbi:MAG: hypothetical protein AVW06_01885 [Hadesarchaea archaeon DG-33-1]|nr:MAG: hypothetical protein AVW06_01885 [Hadesarchaea archaeon DG-33-1]
MMRVLLWLLPVVDVFALKRILKYYRSLGVRVPWGHAKAGVIERWVGYIPAGFAISWLAGFWPTFLIALIVLALLGPIELYLMCRGVWPWKFFVGRPFKSTTKIFLLEGYNAIGYYLLGALLAAFIST